jgi:ferredoxin
VEVCPSVFRLNDTGYIEVVELSSYPEMEVNEAIKYCPEDCIYWEEV